MADPGCRGALVVLSGLPGVGKTTVARLLSSAVGAVHLRIDTIETAMVESGIVAAAGGWDSAPDIAAHAGVPVINVEIVCTDIAVHRSRVEERASDLTGLVVPTWEQVQRREYEPWTTPVLRVDSARGVEQSVREVAATIVAALQPGTGGKFPAPQLSD